jgi:hypothetical protein
VENSNIISLEEELRQAMLSGNVDKLDKLISDSLVFTAPSGAVIGKQEDIESHRSGLMQFSRLEPSEQRVQNYGNFAVVAVKMAIDGTYNNEPVAGTFCYTRVWAESEGRWQVIAGQVSQIS